MSSVAVALLMVAVAAEQMSFPPTSRIHLTSRTRCLMTTPGLELGLALVLVPAVLYSRKRCRRKP